MNREVVLADQTLIVCDGRIATVGPAESVPIPPSAQRVDGSGKYLIPGLTDSHIHLLSPIEFRLYLANGITTVFNLDGRPAHLRWQKEIAAGTRLGPTIFTSGPIFDQARSPGEDIRLVDEQAEAGYDAIRSTIGFPTKSIRP
jgi:imidazolonepropionase-like amidohydrolase